MITSLFILNSKGDVLMSQFYKPGVKKNISDVFRIQVINSASRMSSATTSSPQNRSPVLTLGSTSFLQIRSGELWFVAVTRSNQDASVIFEFLDSLLHLLELFFARNSDQLSEDDIIGNFGFIYEILGEVVDFGYPVSMEPSHLISVIPGLSTIKLDGEVKKKALKRDLNQTADSDYEAFKVSWREQGIKYRKNEIYLNVDEKITLLMDSKGNHLRSNIDGTITMKTHLSGMPVCRFGFSDDQIRDISSSITLDDFKFHKCVDLARYNSEKVIRFVPPDGTFQLMSYHIKEDFACPFDVIPQIIEDDNLIFLKVRIRSKFSSKIAANNVFLRVTVPRGITHTSISSSNGKAKFDPQENVIIWKFSKFYGESEHLLSLDFDSPASAPTRNWFKPKITMDFSMDMFSASGLQVKFLKVVEKSNYRTMKWLKYHTHAGSYEVRL